MAQVLSSVRQTRSFSKGVNIIGFPIHWGQTNVGTDKGPAAIRSSGLVDKLHRKGYTIQDSGDLDINSVPADPAKSLARNWSLVSGACQLLSHSVTQSVRSFSKTVILGGDHSLGIGSIHGHAVGTQPVGEAIAVIWIDAHAGKFASKQI